MHSLALRILLDPASYLDQSRWPSGGEPSAVLRAAFNGYLIRQTPLPWPVSAELNALETEVTRLWFSLRRIAYLLGAWRLRQQLVQSQRYLQCDQAVRQFLLKAIPSLSPVVGAHELSEVGVLAAGVTVLAPLAGQLAEPWFARLLLLFPAALTPALHTCSAPAIDRAAIYTAFYHEQNL